MFRAIDCKGFGPMALTESISTISWRDGATWRRASYNTMWCLIGCSIGDLGTILFFQVTVQVLDAEGGLLASADRSPLHGGVGVVHECEGAARTVRVLGRRASGRVWVGLRSER